MPDARPPNTINDTDDRPSEYWFEGRLYQGCFDPDAGAWRVREIGAGHPDAWQVEDDEPDWPSQGATYSGY